MSDWFEQELKRMPGGLHLRRSSLHSKAAGLHPHTLQVWAKGEVSGQPYLVMHLVDRQGNPRSPCSRDLARIRAGDRAKLPGVGAKGWVDTQLAKLDAKDSREHEKALDETDYWYKNRAVDTWNRKTGRTQTMQIAPTPKRLKKRSRGKAARA